jgi:peptide/nickel transport system ATP-binding protein
MIFQDPLTSLNPLFTIESQLCETIRFHLRLSEAQARNRALELLASVGIPEPERRLKQYPHHFSGGMRQRVVIAMALSCDPKLIIADEPTTALDVSVQAQILDLISELCKQRDVGVLLVTHDIGVIAETADRMTVMYRGRVVETGSTSEVLGAPKHAYTQSLIAAVPRPDVKLARFPRIEYSETGKAAAPVVLQPPPAPPTRQTTASGTLLELDGITVEFAGRRGLLTRRHRRFRAVDNVSFTIAEGETFVLVGESGSGKSTLANVITGLLRPLSGTVRFAGDELTALPSESQLRPYRRQMQMIFQDPYSSLNARMRVGDIIA